MPRLDCDLVMKGGITSGVIYPPLVEELSDTYAFRSIGGTSAGAIAAAATAAAEHGRRRGEQGGFARLGALPRELGRVQEDGRSRLSHLFQPSGRTRPLFDLAMAALDASSGRAGKLAVASAAVGPNLGRALAAASPGIALVALGAWVAATGGASWIVVAALAAAGLAVAAVGLAVGTVAGLARTLSAEVPANGFGLCSGMPDPAGPTSRHQPLTPWLTELLDTLAGKDPEGPPLTFGDLWEEGGSADEPVPPAERRAVTLEMVTTCLTHGRPYRLPFETKIFFFDPEEMRRLFPARIVRHLVEHQRRPVRPDDPVAEHGGPLLPFPDPADVPVVVATRMSLSFPGLLSAVPLHAVDYSWSENADVPPGARTKATRLWFSDGGISSNFPVHFFDAPLPGRPTFGVNLRDVHPARPDSRVWLPDNNRGGTLEWVHDMPGEGLRGLAGFFGRIFGTMQAWMDDTQIGVPGYRDRVVHVSHTADEGGLNLDMPERVIVALGERGREAGRRLKERFAWTEGAPPSAGWTNHRWVRLRSTLALLEDALLEARVAWGDGGPSTFSSLLREGGEGEAYALPAARRALVREHLDALARALDQWVDEDLRLAQGAPRPPPELQIRPRM